MRKRDDIIYDPCIDVIKIFATIVIVCHHFYGHLIDSLHIRYFVDNIPVIEVIFTDGYLLVELFFLISGMLFYRLYSDRIKCGVTISDFMKYRAVSFFPIAIITTVYFWLMELISYAINGELWSNCGSIDFNDMLLNILFMGERTVGKASMLNGSMWYLNVLFLCYFMACIIVKLQFRYNETIYIYVPVFLGLVIRVNRIDTLIFNQHVARGLMGFFGGMVLEELLNKNFHFSFRKKWKLVSEITWGEVIFFLTVFPYTGIGRRIITDKILYCNFLLFPCLLLFCGVFFGNSGKRGREHRIIRQLSLISFHVYMWNMPVLITIYLLVKCLGLSNEYVGSVWILPVVVVIHYIMGFISYVFIDKRIGNFLKINCHD